MKIPIPEEITTALLKTEEFGAKLDRVIELLEAIAENQAAQIEEVAIIHGVTLPKTRE